MQTNGEWRITTVADGVRAKVVERQTILPPELGLLLGRMLVLDRGPWFRLGTRRDCTDEQHEWARWLHGVYRGVELLLAHCGWCDAVEVRDISLDILPGLPVGRGGPRRKSDVLGWYSGERPAGRTYL